MKFYLFKYAETTKILTGQLPQVQNLAVREGTLQFDPGCKEIKATTAQGQRDLENVDFRWWGRSITETFLMPCRTALSH